ncbi:YIP1 family protein [Candidatus Woesearchaeota archaeon]|nr:YIP1 family protein [Candidatus Woesearchaeota archaeon]
MLTDPEFVFKRVKHEGYLEPLLYYTFLFVIFSILTLPATLINGALLGSALQGMDRLFFFVLIPFGILIGLLVAIAIMFGFAGLVHLFVRLFNKNSDFMQTFKAVAYGSTPSLTIGIIIAYLALVPILGSLFIIPFVYNIVLVVIGLKSLQSIKTSRAAFAVIIPVLILSILFRLTVLIFVLRAGLA